MIIKYPHIREDLIDTMKCLSDYDYQATAWLKNILPNGRHDTFDMRIHFLYDDTPFADDSDSTVGLVLYDNNESELVKSVISSINNIFNKYGKNLSDEEYINLPEWKNVLNSAKVAYDYLVANDKVKGS